MRKPIVLFLLLAAVPAANASDVGRISADPERGTTEIMMPHGVRAVFDYRSQHAYISRGAEVIELSFEEIAAQHAPGDPAAQQRYIRDLNSHLSPLNEPYTLTTTPEPRVATDYSRFPFDPPGSRPGGPDLKPRGRGTPGLGGPCDLGPCSPQTGRDGRMFYMYDANSLQFEGGSASGIGTKGKDDQLRWAADYDLYRGQVCGLGIETGAQVVSWATAVATCGALSAASGPAFGFTAAACAATIGGGLVANGMKNRGERQCTSGYPGPGQW